MMTKANFNCKFEHNDSESIPTCKRSTSFALTISNKQYMKMKFKNGYHVKLEFGSVVCFSYHHWYSPI